MAQERDFNFPGFRFEGSRETGRGDLLVTGFIKTAGQEFKLVMFLSGKARSWGVFGPASISLEEREIWRFQWENHPGRGEMAMAGEMPVIALLTPARDPHGIQREEKILRVIPLEDLPSRQRIEIAGQTHFLGRERAISELLSLKRKAGEFLQRQIELTTEDQQVISDEEKTKAAKAEAERQAKEMRRQQRRERILNRKRIFAWTSEGRRVNGIPVTAEEFPCLEKEFVILVDSFNDETDERGPATEAFYVKKTGGGRPIKERRLTVCDQDPRKKGKEESIKAIGLLQTNRGKVILFKTLDEIRSARQQGLNGGVLVAAQEQIKGDKVAVYSATAQSQDPIGELPFTRIQ